MEQRTTTKKFSLSDNSDQGRFFALARGLPGGTLFFKKSTPFGTYSI
jgi:hypothetical protein